MSNQIHNLEKFPIMPIHERTWDNDNPDFSEHAEGKSVGVCRFTLQGNDNPEGIQIGIEILSESGEITTQVFLNRTSAKELAKHIKTLLKEYDKEAKG